MLKEYVAIRAFISCAGQYKGAFWVTATVFAIADIVIAVIPWLIGRLTTSLTTADGHIVLWAAMLIVASIGHDILWRSGEILYLKLLLARSYRFDDAVFAAILQHPY